MPLHEEMIEPLYLNHIKSMAYKFQKRALGFIPVYRFLEFYDSKQIKPATLKTTQRGRLCILYNLNLNYVFLLNATHQHIFDFQVII